MKHILFCILFMFSTITLAQTIENPTFKVRSGSITNITRIERTPKNTRVFIHAIFRPHWWIKESGKTYLRDVNTGKKYAFQSAEGIELNKEVYMSDSGQMDYTLIFDPLPKETKEIDYIDPEETEGRIYGISLDTKEKKKRAPLNAIKGNWYEAGGSNSWKYGIYDSITIMHNQIYTNKNIRIKGKAIEMTVQNKKNGNTSTLRIIHQKGGNCTIQINNEKKLRYVRQDNPTEAITPEADFSTFFRKDTAFLQGYIDGYDPCLGFENSLVYLTNKLTRKDYPTVININPDGSFEGKIVLNHPMESAVVLSDCWIPFYIEPGQTLTIYIDWEAILAYNRARDRHYPIKNIRYMGPSANISQMYRKLKTLAEYRYEGFEKDKKELTPKQFKAKEQATFDRWDQIRDSLSKTYASSPKAVHLIKNNIDLKKGGLLLDFLMSRDYYAKQDTANQVLKVNADSSYYDFLRSMPLDDKVLLADNNSDVFINRFEYMDPLTKAMSEAYNYQPDSIRISYPAQPILSFLKEKGVKLTPEQDQLRLKGEKLAGKTLKVNYKELIDESKPISNLFQAQQALVEEYNKKQAEVTIKQTPDSEKFNKDKEEQQLNIAKRYWKKGESVVQELSGQSNPFLWQVSLIRRLDYELKNYHDQEVVMKYIDTLNTHLKSPILISEAKRMLEMTHPKDATATYQLPEGKSTDIFRNIIKDHQGKVLFVDFWSTGCGPCRYGIEHTADLRKKYKNHPEFKFIYITSDKDSPKESYDAYVKKNLEGEASYSVSETEYNYLRQLFKFNGIPHYELIEKDGSVAVQTPESEELNNYLKKRFGE